MVMGPDVVGDALDEVAGAGAAAVAGLDVITNELYCARRQLQWPETEMSLPIGFWVVRPPIGATSSD
jgi:hypothetical protein